MAATVQIHEMSAVSTGVDRTAGNGPIVFRSNDSNLQTNADPVAVPVGGTAYSYTKQIRINVTVAPETLVENVVAYSDEANGLGTGVGIQYDSNATFQTQIDTDISGSDFFGLTSAAPLDLNMTPSIATGYHADLLRLQLTVAITASPGQVDNDEPLTIAYDES
jgi:hypothetical protein